jgi:hypothetical protein
MEQQIANLRPLAAMAAPAAFASGSPVQALSVILTAGQNNPHMIALEKSCVPFLESGLLACRVSWIFSWNTEDHEPHRLDAAFPASRGDAFRRARDGAGGAADRDSGRRR